LLAQSSDKLVVVRGDRELSLGKTVEVMDIARRSGATKLAIAADYVRAGIERPS
jgi:biopolymer transport protein ExbD